MKKLSIALNIMLALLLLFSLIGNGYQFYLHTTYVSAIKQWKAKLDAADLQLKQLKSELDGEKARVETLNEKADKQLKSIHSLMSEKSELQAKLNNAFCPIPLDKAEIKSISSDRELVNPITHGVERSHGLVSVASSFLPIWRYDESAIFSIVAEDGTVYFIVASWDSLYDRVNTIYNINDGCVYYIFK